MAPKIAAAPRAYWREIGVVLAAKVVALALLYGLFFANKPVVPPTDQHLFHKGQR